MKATKFFLMAALALTGSMVFTACGDDEDENTPEVAKTDTEQLEGYWESEKFNITGDETFEAYTKRYVCIEKSGKVTVVTSNTEVHEDFQAPNSYEWESGTFEVDEAKQMITLSLNYWGGVEQEEAAEYQYAYELGKDASKVWLTENYPGAERVCYTPISKSEFQEVLNTAKGL